MKRIFFLVLLLTTIVLPLQSQVNFSVSEKRISPTEIDIIFSGTIASGWHVYSSQMAGGGPTVASFGIDSADGVELVGGLKSGAGVKSGFEQMFMMDVSYFENKALFTQRVRLTKKQYSLKGYLEYGACNDRICLPPSTVSCTVEGTDGPDAVKTENIPSAKEEKNADDVKAEEDEPLAVEAADSVTDEVPAPSVAEADSAQVSAWYRPVLSQLQSFGEENSAAGRSLLYIFLMGLLGGLLALLTPCVWPIIPMTVSFFLHRSDERGKGIRDAILYGISIIVIYVGLGILITSIFGSNALNDLATNAVFNLFLFLLLIIFAASFLGGFELTLPSSWANKVDAKASATTGLLSIFLMALTLALVSFSCTGPIIGFLLVEVTTEGGSTLAPTVGMLGFALALALPFTLFALFPSWLKKTPRSGSWMNVIKVVLGFVELAFALKFFSVADLAYGWHLLDRETFLALWIAIFALLATYLFGWLKFPHDDAEERKTSVPRFFVGLCSLAFSVYLIPGLWGAPCKAVAAFAPPIHTQDFNLDPVKVRARFDDYEKGMAFAKSVGKPVLIDFTGHGCVNCRKMELAVWHDPEVRRLLMQDYVLISLYVDDKRRLPQNEEVKTTNGVRTLRTIGDKWSYLQESKFGAQTQPFYVALDNDGNALNHSYSYDENVGKYVRFLQDGLKRYREKFSQNNIQQ